MDPSPPLSSHRPQDLFLDACQLFVSPFQERCDIVRKTPSASWADTPPSLHSQHLAKQCEETPGCPREDGRDGLERLRNAPFKLHHHPVLVETAWNCQNLFWEIEKSHPSAQLGD